MFVDIPTSQYVTGKDTRPVKMIYYRVLMSNKVS